MCFYVNFRSYALLSDLTYVGLEFELLIELSVVSIPFKLLKSFSHYVVVSLADIFCSKQLFRLPSVVYLRVYYYS